jgi:hypothetical protein
MEPVSLAAGVMMAMRAKTMMAIAAALASRSDAHDQAVVKLIEAAAETASHAAARVAGSAGIVDIVA